MPDPFAPRPCKDCGMELPYKTLNAGDFLYGGGSISVQSLADDIAESVARNERARARGQQAYSDEITVGATIEMRLGGCRPEDFAAAVRHWGDMGDRDGMSECERVQAAKWCHQSTPGHGGYDDPRPFECTLGAGHEDDHRFEYEGVATA